MLKVILLVVAACVGCQSVPQNINDKDAVAACALVYVLRSTTEHTTLADTYGALFFEGVSNRALTILKEKLDLPKLRLELGVQSLSLPAYSDKVTGKDAMLFEVEIRQIEKDGFSVRVIKSFGIAGAVEYFVDVERIGSEWQVKKLVEGFVS